MVRSDGQKVIISQVLTEAPWQWHMDLQCGAIHGSVGVGAPRCGSKLEPQMARRLSMVCAYWR